jgi:hypothetical protein
LRRELFLDLEDTLVTPIVDGWHSFDIINLDKIRAVMARFDPHVVSIFSFAIWDERQLALFNRHCRPHLEAALGVTFNLVPTVDEGIIPTCCRLMAISPDRVDFSEMSTFWGKQGAFRLWARAHAESLRRHTPNLHLHLLLLDDVVYNEVLTWPDLQATIEQRNIDQL